jgi:SPP1 gp7 family putative phage head morphogenesis protein
VKADLAGQLMVRALEAKRVALKSPTDPPIFVELPFDDAVAEFRKRNLIPPKAVDKIIDTYRKRSEGASELMLRALRNKVEDALDRAVTEGETLRDFVRRMRSADVDLGVKPAQSHYLETIYRTNVQLAYGAGRFRAMTDPDVIAERPYVEYRTVDDSRVRPEHAILHERVWRADDTSWHNLSPPNGFNCRCSIVTLDEAEYRETGRVVTNGVPEGFRADEGFGGAPVETVAEPLAAE